MNLKFLRKLTVSMMGLLCMVCLIMGSSCTPETPAGYTVQPPMELTDRFQTNDLISIGISNIPNPPPVHQERIKDDGSLSLPLIGQYVAVGKTQSEVQAELTALYAKYYKGHVIVVSSEARYFYVTGEVKQPGDKRYVPNMTFLRAIAAAGGYSTFASSKVRVTSANGQSREVNARKIRNNPTKLDFPIWPGDVIDVPKR